MQENREKSINSIHLKKQFTPRAAEVGQFKAMTFREENVASHVSQSSRGQEPNAFRRVASEGQNFKPRAGSSTDQARENTD